MILWAAVAGCQRGASRIYAPGIDAEAAGKQAIALYDTNKDGKISGAELDKCPGVMVAISRIDPSGEGKVTAEAITARIRAWQETRLGRAPLSVYVLRNGRPFADAEVRLVPEPFLGENMQVATGKVRADGYASPTIPMNGPEDLPGVAPGFYRVEITKDGVKVPAKYNSETTLGIEVAQDSPVLREPPRFELRD